MRSCFAKYLFGRNTAHMMIITEVESINNGQVLDGRGSLSSAISVKEAFGTSALVSFEVLLSDGGRVLFFDGGEASASTVDEALASLFGLPFS